MQKLKKEVVMMSIKQKLTGKFFIFLIVPPSHELMC